MDVTKASPPREPDWTLIRQLYEKGEATVAEIAAAHGVTPWAIRKRRTAEGWPVRSPRGKARATGSGATMGAAGRRALIGRLLVVVDRNLKQMEMRMNSDEPGTAADRERETRAIGALTRTIGKLTELESGSTRATAAAPKSRSGSTTDDDEADRLRLEIAERILRLGERCRPR